MITQSVNCVQSLHFKGIQAFLNLILTEDKKMQKSPPNSTELKFIAVFSLAIFLAYSVSTHLVTDAFIAFMSLFFDHFSVKSCGVVPDIALLILFSLVMIGALSVIKNHLTVLISGAALAGCAVLVWGV